MTARLTILLNLIAFSFAITPAALAGKVTYECPSNHTEKTPYWVFEVTIGSDSTEKGALNDPEKLEVRAYQLDSLGAEGAAGGEGVFNPVASLLYGGELSKKEYKDLVADSGEAGFALWEDADGNKSQRNWYHYQFGGEESTKGHGTFQPTFFGLANFTIEISEENANGADEYFEGKVTAACRQKPVF